MACSSLLPEPVTGVRTSAHALHPQHPRLCRERIFVGKNCRTEHSLWKKDQKEPKQRLKQINARNCSANSRAKSGFQRLHSLCVYTGPLALSLCPFHVPCLPSNFSLVFLRHGQDKTQLPRDNFEQCLGSRLTGYLVSQKDKQNR